MTSSDPIHSLEKLVWEWGGGRRDYAGAANESRIGAAELALSVAFPHSYRAFLRLYGAGVIHFHDIFGITDSDLWIDVVQANITRPHGLAHHYVWFTGDAPDSAFYLDTARRDGRGECPVVARDPETLVVIADSFLDFLRMAAAGLV